MSLGVTGGELGADTHTYTADPGFEGSQGRKPRRPDNRLSLTRSTARGQGLPGALHAPNGALAAPSSPVPEALTRRRGGVPT